MSPLPLFLIATALLAAFVSYHLARLCLAPLRAMPPIGRRRQRAQEQIRWDELHPPSAETGV